jgi:hypothetical protein
MNFLPVPFFVQMRSYPTNSEMLEEIIKQITDSIIPSSPSIPDVSGGNKFVKTSLIAPYLASSKNQYLLTVNTSENNPELFDNYLKQNLPENAKFLTVVGAPTSIINRKYLGGFGRTAYFGALDHRLYGDLSGNNLPDLAVGRIQGLNMGSVSSLVARNLFYDDLEKSKDALFMASNIHHMKLRVDSWSERFSEIEFTSKVVKSPKEQDTKIFSDPELWKNKAFITYNDHGIEQWAGIRSSSLPLLQNSFMILEACLVCASFDSASFCNRAVTQGATSVISAVSTAYGSNINSMYARPYTHAISVSDVFHSGKEIGLAFQNAYDKTPIFSMYTLIGDPTLKMGDMLMEEKLTQRVGGDPRVRKGQLVDPNRSPNRGGSERDQEIR